MVAQGGGDVGQRCGGGGVGTVFGVHWLVRAGQDSGGEFDSGWHGLGVSEFDRGVGVCQCAGGDMDFVARSPERGGDGEGGDG